LGSQVRFSSQAGEILVRKIPTFTNLSCFKHVYIYKNIYIYLVFLVKLPCLVVLPPDSAVARSGAGSLGEEGVLESPRGEADAAANFSVDCTTFLRQN